MKHPVIWFEVVGQDADKLVSFYGEMFAWSLKKGTEMEYSMLEKVEEGIPGGVGKAPQGPGWTTFYVKVDDVSESLQRAERLGGKTIMPPMTLPDGMVVGVFQDPEGHPIGVVGPNSTSTNE